MDRGEEGGKSSESETRSVVLTVVHRVVLLLILRSPVWILLRRVPVTSSTPEASERLTLLILLRLMRMRRRGRRETMRWKLGVRWSRRNELRISLRVLRMLSFVGDVVLRLLLIGIRGGRRWRRGSSAIRRRLLRLVPIVSCIVSLSRWYG